MMKTLLAASAVVVGLTGMAGVSQAVPYNNGPQPGFSITVNPYHVQRHRQLSDFELRRALRNQGYREIRFLDRNRLTSIVKAEGRRGRDFILVVSNRTGGVLSRRPVNFGFQGGHGHGNGYGYNG